MFILSGHCPFFLLKFLSFRVIGYSKSKGTLSQMPIFKEYPRFLQPYSRLEFLFRLLRDIKLLADIYLVYWVLNGSLVSK